MSFRIENQTKAKQNRARTIYALQDAVNRVQNPNVSWLQGAIGGGGGGGGGVGGTPTDYEDLGTLDGTSSLEIALNGKAYYLRKVTLANSNALTFGITSENLPENELVELCIYFVQDATGGRTINPPSAVKFPGGDLLNGILGKDPNEVSKFRFTTYDAGMTWFIEKLSLEGAAPVGAPSLADLTDTSITSSLADNHLLVYDASNTDESKHIWKTKLATEVGNQYGNTDVLTYLGTLGKSIWDGIVNLVSSVVGQITTWLENDNGILGWLYDFFTKPTSLGGLGTTITNALKSTMTWLTHAWNDTVGAIMKWFYKLNDSNEILFFPRAYGAGTEPSEDDIDNAATVPSNNKHTPFFSWTNFFSNFWARVTGFAEEVYADIIEWLQDDHGVLGWLYGQWVNISDNFEDAFENLTNLFALTDSSRRPLYVDHDDYPRLSFFGTSDLPITGSTTKADDDSTDLAYNIFYLPQNLWKWFTQSLDAGGTILTNMWNGFTGFLGKWWDRIGTSGFGLSGAFGTIWNAIKTVGTVAWPIIAGMGTTIWSAIKTLGTGAWGVIKDIGSGIWSLVEHGVNFIGGLFYDKSGNDILYYTATEAAKDSPSNGVTTPTNTKNTPKFRWTNFFTGGGGFAAISASITGLADSAITAAVATGKAIYNAVTGGIGSALESGGAIFNQLKTDFDMLASDLGAAAGTLIDDTISNIATWINNLGGGGATTLSGLTDVTLTNTIAGQILVRNATNNGWVNSSPASGGGGASISLNNLSGVSLNAPLQFERLNDHESSDDEDIKPSFERTGLGVDTSNNLYINTVSIDDKIFMSFRDMNHIEFLASAIKFNVPGDGVSMNLDTNILPLDPVGNNEIKLVSPDGTADRSTLKVKLDDVTYDMKTAFAGQGGGGGEPGTIGAGFDPARVVATNIHNQFTTLMPSISLLTALHDYPIGKSVHDRLTFLEDNAAVEPPPNIPDDDDEDAIDPDITGSASNYVPFYREFYNGVSASEMSTAFGSDVGCVGLNVDSASVNNLNSGRTNIMLCVKEKQLWLRFRFFAQVDAVQNLVGTAYTQVGTGSRRIASTEGPTELLNDIDGVARVDLERVHGNLHVHEEIDDTDDGEFGYIEQDGNTTIFRNLRFNQRWDSQTAQSPLEATTPRMIPLPVISVSFSNTSTAVLDEGFGSGEGALGILSSPGYICAKVNGRWYYIPMTRMETITA